MSKYCLCILGVVVVLVIVLKKDEDTQCEMFLYSTKNTTLFSLSLKKKYLWSRIRVAVRNRLGRQLSVVFDGVQFPRALLPTTATVTRDDHVKATDTAMRGGHSFRINVLLLPNVNQSDNSLAVRVNQQGITSLGNGQPSCTVQ